MSVKRSFAPVVDQRTRVLVLGSLPGDKSLERRQYYAHPLNQFWRLMSAVTGAELVPMPYQARLEALLAARVGLWDVVRSATRVGSLDTAIRGAQANALPALAASLPELRAIAFNGGTAARLGTRTLGAGAPFALLPLPSSSSARAIPFAAKLEAWLQLRAFLDSAPASA
ncbi:MAG TPA: DNA-deoxyinosine glycosylase [Allosphingosinicella sp.]|nr:DNA-deoxyinosine glycosylase [Allosphingosinicella sp.]